MKHFMTPRSQILRENHHEAVNTPSSSSPNPKSKPTTPNPGRKHKLSSKENAPPTNSNLNTTSSPASVASKMKSPLPPRPPLKRKLSLETAATAAGLENSLVPVNSLDSGVKSITKSSRDFKRGICGYCSNSNSPVRREIQVNQIKDRDGACRRVRSWFGLRIFHLCNKVIVRVRPPNKDEEDGANVVQKIADDSLSIAGRTFTFDSIADVESKQMDIFQLVGAPLVENCLTGFNSSVFAYGQTGSGKTYTAWGASNALLEEDLGLAPRVCHRLFERIDEEQVKQADRKLVYMCRCSFLEITDLLDPSQNNLQIREDAKSGVYVENLTEECVSSMKDVSQHLIKGLSNQRTGSTSVNAESSQCFHLCC